MCDDLTVSLNFADGSLATIAYTALGDTAYSKELVEAFAGGTVVNIDDFRGMTVTAAGKESKQGRSIEQDKGHAAELEAFAKAVASGGLHLQTRPRSWNPVSPLSLCSNPFNGAGRLIFHDLGNE